MGRLDWGIACSFTRFEGAGKGADPSEVGICNETATGSDYRKHPQHGGLFCSKSNDHHGCHSVTLSLGWVGSLGNLV